MCMPCSTVDVASHKKSPWQLLSAALRRQVATGLGVAGAQALRALDRSSLVAGGALYRHRLQLPDHIVLDASAGEHSFSSSSRPSRRRPSNFNSLRNVQDNVPVPMLSAGELRRRRSWLNSVLSAVQHWPNIFACKEEALNSLTAGFQAIEATLQKESMPAGEFVNAVLMALPVETELAWLRQSLYCIDDPEVLVAAVPWPDIHEPCCREALMLAIHMTLSIEPLASSLLERTGCRIEIGLIDDSCMDIVPRVSCEARHFSAARLMAIGQWSISDVCNGRLLRAITDGLLMKRNEELRLAVWLRCDWNRLLVFSPVEVLSARMDLVVSELSSKND
mmetsp:Transcript_11861/g.27011  ORF Transcript_11861/g.27011 Transcript_11861/m.27011 type:complete len:335 (-) Transcript_11861:58-1062(-)